MIDNIKLSKGDDISKIESNYLQIDYKKCRKKAREYLINKVCGNCVATGELLISLYLQNHQYKTSLKKDNLNTKVCSLAKLRGLTPRTIHNHFKSLVKCQFIYDYQQVGNSIIVSFSNQVLYDYLPQIFPSLVPVLQEPINNNSNKDNYKDPGGQIVSLDDNSSKNVREVDKELLLSLNEFWASFKQNFYSGQNFNEWEEKEVKNLIWAGLFNKFQLPPNYPHWYEFKKVTLERMRILKKYLQKDKTERFIVHPLLYFDSQNLTNGFSATYHWFIKNQLIKIKVRSAKKDHEKPLQAYQKARHRLNKLYDWQLEEEYLKCKSALLGSYKTTSYHA
jgi:hypothetical protein